MSKLVLIDSETSEPIKEFDLREGTTTVGRSDQNDIIINSPSVSTHHATIMTERNDSFLLDKGSTNGTFVNGKRTRNSALEDKDVINIGSNILIFIQTRRQRVSDSARAKLEVLNGSRSGKAIPLQSNITSLGETEEQLAVINYRHGQYIFSQIDAGPHGQFCSINGKQVSYEPVPLDFGDIILINGTELRLTDTSKTTRQPSV